MRSSVDERIIRRCALPTRTKEAALREVLASFHRRSQHTVAPTLAGLVAAWGRFVQQIEGGYACSIYDYTNDLSTRDLLDELIELVPSILGADTERELEPKSRDGIAFRETCTAGCSTTSSPTV